jgi:hypothetical protein
MGDHLTTEAGDSLVTEDGLYLVLDAPLAIPPAEFAPSGRAGARRFTRLPRATLSFFPLVLSLSTFVAEGHLTRYLAQSVSRMPRRGAP